MAPTNEVLRQFVGKMALLGPQSLDYRNQSLNERVLQSEHCGLSKMVAPAARDDIAVRAALAAKLAWSPLLRLL